ncbi:hypothetical protein ACJJIU_00935 [Microbulbifer sp. CnH-101-E]|uniref:hypothetical protein n=1 Tax=unclassified Microbulbifer TaxID=2619833 RepID=UPI00403A23A2
MRNLTFILITLLTAACNASDKKVTDRAEIEGHSLILETDKGICILHIKDKELFSSKALDIAPPCFFLRQGTQEPQSFSYPDNDILSVIMVVGSPAPQEKRERWGIREETICGESRQGILFKESGEVVAGKTLKGGLVCKDKGADEKDFWYLAH